MTSSCLAGYSCSFDVRFNDHGQRNVAIQIRKTLFMVKMELTPPDIPEISVCTEIIEI